jgi:branched-chain amino acid transport system ATP-binding protein
MNRILEVKNLMVFYENAIALNDFSFHTFEGEVLGIFGSNAAGKSTLLNTISGLTLHLKIKEARRRGVRITVLGEIKFRGKELIDSKPQDRVKEGIVLARERHPIFTDSIVMENLTMGGYLRKGPEIRESIDFVFSIFPVLKGLSRRKAGFLSGGEQQMLIIGMALIAKARLLLLDEPFLGLSPLLQEHLAEATLNIRSQGVTVLVTEQFARPLLPHVDRGYILENGSLVISGTGQELLDNPEVRAAYFGM